MWLLEFGKDNYWTGDKMVEHAIRIALPIFHYAFPNCQALFAFDNASNHCSFSEDALVAKRMNLNPGGQQPIMRDGFDYKHGLPQAMVFSNTHHIPELRGKPKGLEAILRERRLWPVNGYRSDGLKFLLQCPSSHGRPGCIPELEGGCCARTLMASQQDFQQQKGRLEEELQAASQFVIFYPKFHCELDFIERFWCSAKYYARENCEYTFVGLRQVLFKFKAPASVSSTPGSITNHYFYHCRRVLPEVLDSVSSTSINRYFYHFKRVIEAYEAGEVYGTKEFADRVYKSHRRVVDKSKGFDIYTVKFLSTHGPVWRELAELWQGAPQQCGSAT